MLNGVEDDKGAAFKMRKLKRQENIIFIILGLAPTQFSSETNHKFTLSYTRCADYRTLVSERRLKEKKKQAMLFVQKLDFIHLPPCVCVC